MRIDITQVDAFTNKVFGGNPAAVIFTDNALSEDSMRNIAMEMNLSETAFLVQRSAGNFQIRWFTPEEEVPLCGHATLASAHMLFEKNIVAKNAEIFFQSKSGELKAKLKDGWIWLDFPANPVREVPITNEIRDALGFDSLFVGRNDFVYMVEAPDAKVVRRFQPDMTKLAKVDSAGILLTAGEKKDYDIVSRCFFPKIGIPEDPVTGAAHCALGPYWANKLGKNELLAFQASKRGGMLKIRVEGSRVHLAGQAVTTLEGKLLV